MLIYCLVYMNYKKKKIIFVLFVLLLVLALYIFSWIFEAFTFVVTALQLCAVASLLSVAATPPAFFVDRASYHASSKNSYSYVINVELYCLVYMNYKKINKNIFFLFVLLLVLDLYIFSWIFEVFTFIVTALQLCAVASLLTSVAATPPPSFCDRASYHAAWSVSYCFKNVFKKNWIFLN